MALVALNRTGLERAASALRAGEAVVLPFPTPLPYVVAATEPSTVNAAKGRPHDQPCGILVGAAGDVTPHLDLDAPTAALALWIALVERANLFVPLRPDAPWWLTRSGVDGVAGITLAWLDRLRSLADEFGHLYVSSGNRTAGPVCVTAADAETEFDGRRLVLDGDAHRDRSVPHGSATIIDVRRDGVLRVVRDGVHNRAFPVDHDAYLKELRRRYAASRAGGIGRVC